MKLPCEIVQDLLPLYEEYLCSPASRAAVEEHLQECAECRRLVEDINKLEEPDVSIEVSVEEQAVAKSFRKVHRRWKASLIAMLLVFPMLLMTVNQIRCRGICFTNLDDIFVTWRYVQALEDGDFEKVASYMDYENFHEQIKSVVVMEPTDWYGEYESAWLDDVKWLAKKDFYREYLKEDLKWETQTDQFWGNMIYNHVQQVMIPEEIWFEITLQEPGSVMETPDGELYLNDEPYVRLETKWGNYIVHQTSSLNECVTAEDFCAVLALLPAEIFNEAYPELERQAWEEYYWRQETFGAADDMSPEEFTELVRNKYIARLEESAEYGATFEGTGYKSSYYTEGNGHWQIEYGITVITEGGEYPVSVSFCAKGGKILDVASMNYKELPEHLEWMHDIFRLWYSR